VSEREQKPVAILAYSETLGWFAYTVFSQSGSLHIIIASGPKRDEVIQKCQDAGYKVIEAKDRT
jgi:hypothetical protein